MIKRYIIPLLFVLLWSWPVWADSVIVYSRPDGGVSVVNPAPSRVAELMVGGMTEAQALASIQASAMPDNATNVEVMDRALIPALREFRNAWERLGTGPPTINMPKARDIHAAKMAVAVVAEIALLRGQERKQRLRGNTSQADQHAANVSALESLDLGLLASRMQSAPTPAALSAVWPTAVPR